MSQKLVVPKNRWSDWNNINNNNWAEEFPYAPVVIFRVCHTGDSMQIEYNVHEKYTRAIVQQDNGKVWEDSCVEFFISFDESGYYNLETTCIGVALLGFRKTKPNVTHASEDVLKLIVRESSYKKECFNEIEGDNVWTLKLTIPKEVFFAHKFESLNGIKAKANFYKCGDGLKKVHFLSWNAIDLPKPNFHVPEFFGDVVFE